MSFFSLQKIKSLTFLLKGEAAARINAMLAQKGIPLHDEVHGLSDLGLKNEGEFVKDIPINDLKNRYMLTRGATQTQIQQETGAGKLKQWGSSLQYLTINN